MPDVMTAPTQLPIPSAAGNSKVLRLGEASGSANETSASGDKTAAQAPFADMLKAQTDKAIAAFANAGETTILLSTAPDDGGNQPIPVDLLALLSVIETTAGASPSVSANLPETQDIETLQDDKTEVSLADGQVTATPLSVQLIAALPASPVAAEAVSRTSVDTIETQAGSRQPGSDRRAEALISAEVPKTPNSTPAPGKIASDAAINADIARRGEDVRQADVPASDFDAVLERAVATATTETNPANRSAPSTSLRVETPMGQRGWHEEVGQKLTWMIGNGRQQADLVLTPPHLGRVEVSLTMSGDNATAIFTSASPAVREALEGSLHRLREVLADAGVSLGQTQVGSESPHQSRARSETGSGLNRSLPFASSSQLTAIDAVTITNARAGRGMIDVFA